ncbi:winged helix-turn-helix transcriptional regulator [Nocardia asiatica]|uniref:winged helix-turn-helix transcriptional regulator n=1 Tax=Nocardia asiatica TaxID=209252 RepID=UPI003EDF6FDD
MTVAAKQEKGQMRTYGDACAVAHGLDLIGERWALLVVRELLFGPKRFSDLQEGLPLASTNILTQRLRELVDAGVVVRRRLGPPARAWVYDLTEWGRDLEPLLVQLGRWASRSSLLQAEGDLSVDSLMLALTSHFDSAGWPHDVSATIAITLGDDHFAVRIADGRMRITREQPHSPDAALITDSATLNSIVFGGARPRPEAVAGSSIILGHLLDAIA